MYDYREEIISLIEKCLHKFAELRIIELGIQDTWRDSLATEINKSYSSNPTGYMTLYRFLKTHPSKEIELNILDTTAMHALYKGIPDFKLMCDIKTAPDFTFINCIQSLKNSRNSIEHYVKTISPEQEKDFYFDQLNALYAISYFSSLVERYCKENDVWKRIIIDATQMIRSLHWEKWLLPNDRLNEYSNDNLSDILFSAESGNLEAQIKAGKIYFYGRHSVNKPDYDRAYFWFTKATFQRSPEAKYYLANCLLHNYTLPDLDSRMNIVKKLIEESALAGYAPAQYEMSHYDSTGANSTPEDKIQHYKWVKLSADQEYPPAIWSLAICYACGIGVEKNMNQYYKLALRASELGYAYASESLGKEAEKNKDYKKALEYYRLAEKQGGLTIKSLVRKMEQKLNTID